jgi:hypothetical protein
MKKDEVLRMKNERAETSAKAFDFLNGLKLIPHPSSVSLDPRGDVVHDVSRMLRGRS